MSEHNLSAPEIELLEELRDCGGQVNASEYTRAQINRLREMEKKRVVALRWVLTVEGQKIVGKP